MKIWVCVATAASMMGVGIALEIGLAISARNGGERHQYSAGALILNCPCVGFSVPQQNVVSFVSPQFLLSFFPTVSRQIPHVVQVAQFASVAFRIARRIPMARN